MAILGLLSLVQIVVLPGYLLLRALRIGSGILSTGILSFALSLVINHFLVAGLVVLRVYRPGVIYAVFAAELALLLAWDGHWLRLGLADTLAAGRRRLRDFLREIEAADAAKFSFLRRWLVLASVLVIGCFAMTGLAQVGQIFQQWDAVVSWNRWAVDWAANRLPYATSIYPQLLPTNLSLSYVFMQSSEVWIFAKSFQFLFCLMLLATMLDMARVESRFGYVPGVIVTYCLLVALLRFRMLSSGYADLPLAFLAVASIYVLLLAEKSGDAALRNRFLILGALLAVGAALTKQNGLYVAAIYPLLAWRFVLGGLLAGLRRHLPALARICLLMAILILPWYVYKFFDFRAGHDKNNTAQLLADFHEGRSLSERFSHSALMIADAITPPGAILLMVAIAASFADRRQRWMLAVFVIPLGLIWALGFSYDLRNLALVIPWVGGSAGIGLAQIATWATSRKHESRSADRMQISKSEPARRDAVPQQGSWRVGHLAGISLAVLVVICLCVRDETLRDAQRRQQRTVGLPELNRQLYVYAADHPSQTTIATDYQAMRWLPELARRSMICTCHELHAFRQAFDRSEVGCVLVRTAGAAAEVQAFLKSQTAARLVFEDHGFAFYEKRR
jgi:hypothetical protein